MIHPKKIFFSLCTIALLGAATAQAQATFDFDSIDTLLADNMLEEAANRYASVVLSFQPEQATRLGFASANSKLNARTPEQSANVLAALRSVRSQVEQLDEKQLSAAKQADRELLLNALNLSIAQEEQNRLLKDPLYYTQAVDASYDLLLKPSSTPSKQRKDVAARLAGLPQTAEQAEKNLSAPAPFLAQLAMEKAYYAYLTADEWEQELLKGVAEEDAKLQAQRTTQNAKVAVRKMFDLFKRLSQEESSQDFRLGEGAYFTQLKQQYQLNQKPAQFTKTVEKNLQQAQDALTRALDPFLQPQEDDSREITVVDGLNQPSTEKVKPAKKTARKKSAKDLSPRNAQDFYAVAQAFVADETQQPLQTLQQDAAEAYAFLTERGVLPAEEITFSIRPLPAYYAYTLPYLLQPPFGNQSPARTDFFLRLPSGSQQAQEEQLNQYFNLPARKVLVSTELVPGRYYQALHTGNTSLIRRMYPAQSMLNAWPVYARRLAKEQGYLGLDEDFLFLAWSEYLQALQAWTDVQLHTRRYSYADAMEFLTQQHGLKPEQAEGMIKHTVRQPGQSASYLIGLQALEQAHQKYRRKMGKKFSEADFNAKLMKIGNVTPQRLDKELERLYKKDKNK